MINKDKRLLKESAKFNLADCELVGFSLGGKTWEIKKK